MRFLRSKNVPYASSLRGALLLAMLIGLLPLTDLLEPLELRSHAARFLSRAEVRRPDSVPIVIVEISDATLKAWPNEPMNFWEQHFADAIQNALKKYQAAYVGVDYTFEYDVDSFLDGLNVPDYRPGRELREVVGKSERHVVLADLFTSEGSLIPPYKNLAMLASQNVGFITNSPSPDKVTHWMGLYNKADNGRIVPSFAALLAALRLGREPANPKDLQALARGGIPTGVNGVQTVFWINYAQPAESGDRPFHLLSMEKLAAGTLEPEESAWLHKAMVLIGPAYLGANDYATGADGRDYRGIEIHAQALATLLDGSALYRWPRGAEAFVTLSAGLFCCLLLWRQSPFVSLPVCWAAALWWWFGAVRWAFAERLLLPAVGPVAVMLLPAAFYGLARLFQEHRRSEQSRQQFVRYVPEPVADAILAAPHQPLLHDQLCDISVLFFDIRGSTAYAQFRDPTQVMREFNQLFGVAQPIVTACGGTLNRYTGDGFLALFGLDAGPGNHAQHAVDAARKLFAEIRAINAARKEKDDDCWGVGCGIHSGTVVCGNLGTEARRDYTVLGETVNVAARLESLNKKLDSQLVISRVTWERLRKGRELFEKAQANIDGRETPEDVYFLRYSLLPDDVS